MVPFNIAGGIFDKVVRLINYTGLSIFQAKGIHSRYDGRIDNSFIIPIYTSQLQRNTGPIQSQNSNPTRGLEDMHLNYIVPGPQNPYLIQTTPTVIKKGDIIKGLNENKDRSLKLISPVLPEDSVANRPVQFKNQHQAQPPQQKQKNEKVAIRSLPPAPLDKNAQEHKHKKSHSKPDKKTDQPSNTERRALPISTDHGRIIKEAIYKNKVIMLINAIKKQEPEKFLIEDCYKNHFGAEKTFLGQRTYFGEKNFSGEAISIRHGTELGAGANGPVIAGRHIDTKELFALKTIKIQFRHDHCLRDDILHELSIMSQKNTHRNIVTIRNIYFDGKNNRLLREMDLSLVFVMDMMSCSLSRLIACSEAGKVPKEHALYVFNEVAHGLMHLREHLGLFHSDLKPDNILISTEGDVKIADFETSKDIKVQYSGYCGTLGYMAPEVADEDKKFGHKSDIWSFGLVLINMLDGMKGKTRQLNTDAALVEIANTKYSPYCKTHEDAPYLYAFIRRLVEINVKKRISLTELKLHLKIFVDNGIFPMSHTVDFRIFFKKTVPARVRHVA